jgi:hypothetical protein
VSIRVKCGFIPSAEIWRTEPTHADSVALENGGGAGDEGRAVMATAA